MMMNVTPVSHGCTMLIPYFSKTVTDYVLKLIFVCILEKDMLLKVKHYILRSILLLVLTEIGLSSVLYTFAVQR